MTNSYTKTRIRNITRHFDLIPLSSKSIASFYRKNAIIQIQTERGTYAIKPFFRNLFLRSSTIHQIKTTANYIQLLMECDFSYMPKWLPSNSGKLWTMNQGRPFYITPWINGRNLENQKDFEALGRALATLHTTSSRFLYTKGPFTTKQIRIWKIQDLLFRRRMAKAIQTNKQYNSWYTKYEKHCKIISDRAWTDLRTPEIADLLKKELDRPTLIHNDITSPNVIISDDNQLFIIDWDHIKVGSIYVDVAKALMNTTQFNPDFIQSLLKGYEEIYPFEKTERKLISSLYGLPREAWQASRFPNSPKSREMLDIMEQTWLLRLKAIDLLEEWINQ